MRVISQDGTDDIPYENFTFSLIYVNIGENIVNNELYINNIKSK